MKMISVLVIFMESIAAWLCIHWAFEKKIVKIKGELIFCIFYLSLFVLCSYGILDKYFYILFWLFTVMWCKHMFGYGIISTLIRTTIGIVAVGVAEMLVMLIYTYFTYKIELPIEIECMVISFLLVVATAFLYSMRNNRNGYIHKHKNAEIIVFGVLIILFFLYAKFEYEMNKKVPIIYVMFFVLLTIIYIHLCKKQKSIFELEKKTLSMDLQNMYGTAYDELLKDVRRRQHDYKNQLATLKSAVELSGTSHDIKRLQSDYLSIIESENEINSLLSKCCNPIIAGCIYNMYRKYREAGIRLAVDVNIDDSEINIKTKDAVEILGVFVTNACEHVEEFETDDRVVSLKLYNKGDKLTIEVRNIAEPILYGDMSKLFMEGYSTKGENRGIGLASVKAIAKKYNSGVNIDNILVGDKNWVSFRVTI